MLKKAQKILSLLVVAITLFTQIGSSFMAHDLDSGTNEEQIINIDDTRSPLVDLVVQNFVVALELGELPTETLETVKIKAKAHAESLINGEDLTANITVDEAELAAINQSTGGTYPLTFRAAEIKGGTPVIERIVQVFVMMNKPVPPIAPGITAQDFTINLVQAERLTAEMAKTKASATEIDLITGEVSTDNVTVDIEQLATIQVATMPGIYPLTFKNSSGVPSEVKVEIVEVGTYILEISDFEMSTEELQNYLDQQTLEEEILKRAGAKVLHTDTGIEQEIYDGLKVEIADEVSVTRRTYDIKIIYDYAQHAETVVFSTGESYTNKTNATAYGTNTIIEARATMTITEDTLPKTGTYTFEVYVIGLLMLMGGTLILFNIKKQKNAE